jgi:hypothetical protein
MRLASFGGVLGASLVWLGIAALAAFQFWPHLPRSVAGWVLFVLFAPLLYLLAEAIGEGIGTTRLARFISEHPSKSVRILLGVLAGGIPVAVILTVSMLLQ